MIDFNRINSQIAKNKEAILKRLEYPYTVTDRRGRGLRSRPEKVAKKSLNGANIKGVKGSRVKCTMFDEFTSLNRDEYMRIAKMHGIQIKNTEPRLSEVECKDLSDKSRFTEVITEDDVLNLKIDLGLNKI